MYKIKSFTQFLNEFELEGEHQSEQYKFLIIKNTKYNSNLYWVIDNDSDVSQFLKDKIERDKAYIDPNEIKLMKIIPRDEVLKKYNTNKVWVYFDKNFKGKIFNPTENIAFDLK